MSKHPISTRLALASIALACAGAVHAQTAVSSAEYSAIKDRIQADYKTADEACDRLSGNAEDVCEAQAEGREQIALAELDYRRSGSAEDARKVTLVKAEANFEVAKERCDDLKGNDEDVCIKKAEADHTRAMADAEAATETTQARAQATEDKRDADYDLAIEKCDSLSGAAKSECTDAAKVRFGKS